MEQTAQPVMLHNTTPDLMNQVGNSHEHLTSTYLTIGGAVLTGAAHFGGWIARSQTTTAIGTLAGILTICLGIYSYTVNRRQKKLIASQQKLTDLQIKEVQERRDAAKHKKSGGHI